jgi:hypothetical protein
MSASTITSGKCEVCRQAITPENPAQLVQVRNGHGAREHHYGADVHIACLPSPRVVHSHGHVQTANRHGFLHAGH